VWEGGGVGLVVTVVEVSLSLMLVVGRANPVLPCFHGSCCSGRGIIIVGILDANGKSCSRFTRCLLICVQRASRSKVCGLGVASLMGEMLQEMVGCDRGAGDCFHCQLHYHYKYQGLHHYYHYLCLWS